jgi:16S rRNA processing protein RimM
MADSWLPIGAVTSVNPARRVIRVEPFPGHAHEFTRLERIRLRLPDAVVKTCRVAAVKPAAQDFLITLVPGVTRDTVAGMRGAELVLDPAEQTAPPEGEFDLEQLPGMQVVDGAGRDLGRVRDAFATPANAIVEVETPAGQTILLPMIEEVIAAVDVAAGRIRVHDIGPYAAVQDMPAPGPQAQARADRPETPEEGR